jgi:hypothetical protein
LTLTSGLTMSEKNWWSLYFVPVFYHLRH